MQRFVSLTAGMMLIGGLTLVAPQDTKKPASLRCTLTQKKIEKCCCKRRGEKQYCTLAKKTIDKCCCEPINPPSK